MEASMIDFTKNESTVLLIQKEHFAGPKQRKDGKTNITKKVTSSADVSVTKKYLSDEGKHTDHVKEIWVNDILAVSSASPNTWIIDTGASPSISAKLK